MKDRKRDRHKNKGDRHKNKGDRHKNKGDRHKNKGDRHKNRKRIVIAGIDGEAIKHEGKSYYVYLAIGGKKPLIASEIRSLNTKEIFEYILQIPKTWRLVGFVLNYDIENWLRDIPDSAYLYLTGDMDIKPENDEWQIPYKEYKKGKYAGRISQLKNSIVWQGYKIFWIPRKIFEIQHIESGRKTKILDCWGYCQSSFVKAIENWKVAEKHEIEMIKTGKEGRESFSYDEIEEIQKYNQLELELLVKLVKKIMASSQKAIDSINMNFTVNCQDMYGPGALSAKILKKLKWPENLGRYEIKPCFQNDFLKTLPDNVEDEQKEYLLKLPFICSYYGGRIEISGVGLWEKIYDYDINSAYPMSITRIPDINLQKCKYVIKVNKKMQEWLINKRFCGMYYISWNFSEKYWWYPFPFRSKKQSNVFFPRNGCGWIASPEFFAAIDTGFVPLVLKAIIIPETEMLGGGEKPLPENLKTEIGKAIEKMFERRKQFKKEEGKGGAEYALKLILNSMYGKLLQQVGRNIEKLGLFNDFVATWITSWTRAMIWRKIAKYAHTKAVLGIMTDGIVSTKKIEVEKGENLGEWDEKVYFEYLQLLPGLYRMKDEKGGIIEKTRGMPKGFDFDKAFQSLYTKEKYEYKYRAFIGRRVWLSQCFALKDQLYQWPELTKEYKPNLASKRRDFKQSLCYLDKFEKRVYLKPKLNISFDNFTSYPFELNFEKPYWIPKTENDIENVLLQEIDEYANFFRE